MAEPLDLATFGVESALKNLRQRIGLRAERHQGTERELDMLAGLDSVQVLIRAGESPERAIVHAVREAAKTLKPTMGIVADVSLGLELSVGRVSDANLYGQELGQRRKALLRNWGQLHELWSALPGPAPSEGVLRLKLESQALAALAVVLTAGVRTEPPSPVVAAADERQARDLRPDDVTASRSASTLLQTFQNVARTLRGRLIRVDGVPTGWQRMLDGPGKEATAVSTAYGIRTMLLLEDKLAADLVPVAQRLKGMGRAGGYAGSGHEEPSAEATAAVLNALGRIAVTDDFDMHIRQMDDGLTDFERARPFILTTMLEASLLLKGGESLVEKLLDFLLKARRSDDGVWSENSDLGYPQPSVAHTARAVRVLADVRTMWSDSALDRPLEQAVDWLCRQRELQSTEEIIERGAHSVKTYHFTAAWVVKALVSAGIPADDPVVQNASSEVWDYYVGDKGDKGVALWRGRQGGLPIWTTFDAIEALRLASLADPNLTFPCRRAPG